MTGAGHSDSSAWPSCPGDIQGGRSEEMEPGLLQSRGLRNGGSHPEATSTGGDWGPQWVLQLFTKSCPTLLR